MAAILALVLASLGPGQGAVAQEDLSGHPKPTIGLVHGAWADASSWSEVIPRLQHDGYKVAAIPNHLRSLYVNAFAPDAGEDVTKLVGPDSALSVPDPTTVFDLVPPTLPPTPSTDLYLKKATVFASFADGLSADDKALVAAIQRPATIAALNEPSGTPAWRTIRSWYVLGTKDKIIPPGVQRSMAQRAGSTITEFNAGRLRLMSDPRTVTRVIERAAAATVR